MNRLNRRGAFALLEAPIDGGKGGLRPIFASEGRSHKVIRKRGGVVQAHRTSAVVLWANSGHCSAMYFSAASRVIVPVGETVTCMASRSAILWVVAWGLCS